MLVLCGWFGIDVGLVVVAVVVAMVMAAIYGGHYSPVVLHSFRNLNRVSTAGTVNTLLRFVVAG